MRQILLLVLLFVVGQWFVKALRRAQSTARPDARPDVRSGGARPGQGADSRARPAGASSASSANSGTGSNRTTGALPEPMVRCAECGVHAPRSESLAVAGQSFCCEEHAQRHAARAAGRDTAAR
ncbi:deaminase [Burkholderia sp. WAC0059]|uniref:PP0621 family protein n=1 Tax=Burkholderia sp. WAC0059 TaxID=2066022 RepID=UPI000C7EE065|nr:PP0621 family protein [Burkholderia sp. WAC0059]PLZ01624.1 deaminase [Burkholderia sp. WAC0059]